MRVVSLRAVDVSEFPDKIDKLTDEVEAEDLKLHMISGLVAETGMFREKTAKL